MKVVFAKIRDPIAWREPSTSFFEDDKKSLVCHVVRYAGLLIDETDSTLVIGEITIAKDNPELKEFGITFPRFRGITVLAKECIVDRQDFEIKEETTL